LIWIASIARSSAPSTSLNAAQLTTTSGRCDAIARSIAAESDRSRSCLARETTSARVANVAEIVLPSCPCAPVTRIFIDAAARLAPRKPRTLTDSRRARR
jgi:hypothetical protein